MDSTLAPTLERGATSYKLCLHQRDFPPNASLYDTVAVATESSSRVLVVLSKVSLNTSYFTSLKVRALLRVGFSLIRGLHPLMIPSRGLRPHILALQSTLHQLVSLHLQ